MKQIGQRNTINQSLNYKDHPFENHKSFLEDMYLTKWEVLVELNIYFYKYIFKYSIKI